MSNKSDILRKSVKNITKNIVKKTKIYDQTKFLYKK
jgi:hypothetical protein